MKTDVGAPVPPAVAVESPGVVSNAERRSTTCAFSNSSRFNALTLALRCGVSCGLRVAEITRRIERHDQVGFFCGHRR